ncbi:tubulin binding cofactor C-domain-containing protein [Syncephalastrum racemosum]|uniref:Tubulin binding cofactor C-domain-containing protein n=1 Tax=Syncephalastrum racemosum TaxID=13706 RepID=A0A1X2HFZ0_SYNRA|nr:tubulin binding cofactor C-domain-containing protein [Syncephalastrum racemosum]
MANVAEASNDFWVHFKAKRASIEDRIHESAQINKAELPGHFNEILQRINELEKQLTKATEYIPSYDARQYVLQIKELSNALESAKASLTPKPKFSFKSRKPKIPSSVGNPSSLVSLPLQQPDQPKQPDPSPLTSLTGNVITFSQCHNQLVRPSSLPGHSVDVALSELDRCFVWLKDTPISALHIKNVTNSVIICSKIEGSALIYGLTHSILTTACHQFRMHDAHDVDILLAVTSKPIIEDSDAVRVGPVSSADPINYFDQVEDFNWLKKQASPNWRLMDATESSAVRK